MAISNRKPGRSRWFEGTAMALVSGGMLFTSTPAYADCYDAAPDFGDTVTCDGDPPNPSRTEFLPVAGAAAIGPAEIFPTAGEDATWLAAPESGDFNTAANWDPASTPGSGDTAFFGTSSITSLTFSADTTVGGWTFNSGANSFDFTIGAGGSLIFDGAGIVINGGRATIVNNGNLLFSNASTAGSAWITNNDRLSFSGNSTAGSAVITNNAGGAVDFSASTGPAGDGRLTAAALSGAGDYFLGHNELTVTNVTSTVSGVISGTGSATGVSLIKDGTSTFTLSGANTYTGATLINGGTLGVDGSIVSAVTVNSGGTLGGLGVAGAVTSIGGTIAPGSPNGASTIGTLTTGDLALDADSVFEVEIDEDIVHDLLVVNGTVSLAGTLSVIEFGEFVGNPFRYLIIDNDGADAISGTFDTLENRFAFLTPSVNYAAGDGNDVELTLTPDNLPPGGDASWLQSPPATTTGTAGTFGTYNVGENWDSGVQPADTAFFGRSNVTNIAWNGEISRETFVGGWTFNSDADDYFFSVGTQGIFFEGAGIVVNGGSVTIDVGGSLFSGLTFNNSSTAGNAMIINGADVEFNDTSSAGDAVIDNEENVRFFDDSTAGNATINRVTTGASLIFNDNSTAGNGTINGSVTFNNSSSAGSATLNLDRQSLFRSSSTAGSATINNDSIVTFQGGSTAGSATIVNDFLVDFQDNSTGGEAQIVTNPTDRTVLGGEPGTDFSRTTGPNDDNALSVGSIAGAGNYFLGANQLTTGSNNLSTEVSGVIADGGLGGGVGGGLTKMGTGTFTLSGEGTYTGPTRVNGGSMIVHGVIVSDATVNAGARLGGSGTVGAVISAGGTLAPGASIGTLTVNGDLVLDAAST
ncbi:autotransporter-associated beta strand repeat-containing protein, partial [uncultured Parasphingopyxis sp.]|uniref:beta strand repeat-containing protein n=1 Tax=uncultured Parasphingopyxis sp. TaxID=1547918 RepID=UPI00261D9EDC